MPSISCLEGSHATKYRADYCRPERCMLELIWAGLSLFSCPVSPWIPSIIISIEYHVFSAQGFIDDNTIAGPGNDIEWIHGIQDCYQACRAAGFQIDPTLVGKRSARTVLHSPPRQIADRSESQVLIQQPCHPTARSAILAAILSRKTLIQSRAGKCIGLTPREASQILNGLDYSTISPLLALECECRCKTALVTVCKKLRKECRYILFFLPPLGFAHALRCNQKASHAVLGNLERNSCVHRCFDRTHQASASSKKFTNGWGPQSLLS